MTAWRYFRQFQLREALEHVAAGGIAIHESGRIVAGKGTAHLLAGGKRQLMNAAEEIGVKPKHVQISPYDHFDLFGRPLILALQRCLNEEPEDAGGQVPRTCRVCGCTDDHACPGGCSWIGLDLCSSCAEKGELGI